ncbi:Nif3-like dinuclear metal center hexameric protein [Oleidesulfovibrio sp.]|uniref:Nif3-like dinuclear metal center hexameric protein n=1 Tax=Oleidesulfovibrio sp. TaxID=2909707 RepID=UPI003A896504
MQQHEFINLIERFAPLHGAAEWDNCGIQIASPRETLTKVAVALDPTLQTINTALHLGADFILTHHPLYMKPKSLGRLDSFHHVVSQLIGGDVALYSAHTSLDANADGPVGWLGRELDLYNIDILEQTHSSSLYSFFIFAHSIEHTSLPAIYNVAHKSGGTVVTFDSADTAPSSALAVIQDASPEGAVVVELPQAAGRETLGLGMIGDLPQECSWKELVALLESKVNRNFWSVCGIRPDRVKRVGYCTGSGSSLADAAFARGADVFITGDVKYHGALDTNGCIIDVGHFSLEEEMMKRFAALLAKHAPDVEITFLPGQDPILLHAVSK